jgi:hypothetical protein
MPLPARVLELGRAILLHLIHQYRIQNRIMESRYLTQFLQIQSDCTPEIRPLKVSAFEISISEFCVLQFCVFQISKLQVGSAQVGTLQFR